MPQRDLPPASPFAAIATVLQEIAPPAKAVSIKVSNRDRKSEATSTTGVTFYNYYKTNAPQKGQTALRVFLSSSDPPSVMVLLRLLALVPLSQSPRDCSVSAGDARMTLLLWLVSIVLVLLWVFGLAANRGAWVWFLLVLALVSILVTLVARGQRL